MTTLEAMARAIAERRKDYGYEATGNLPPGLIEDCRAALQAIREPDFYAHEAGAKEHREYGHASDIYRAMIDHILNEPDPT